MILPANKGNTTVVLDKIQYEEKMCTLLENPVYCKISKDPTGYIERKISKELRELKRKQVFPTSDQSALTIAQLFGGTDY